MRTARWREEEHRTQGHVHREGGQDNWTHPKSEAEEVSQWVNSYLTSMSSGLRTHLKKPDMVAHTCNPSTGDVRLGEFTSQPF